MNLAPSGLSEDRQLGLIGATDGGAGDRDLAGIVLRRLDEVLERLVRGVRLHDDHVVLDDHLGQEGEVPMLSR